MRELNLSVPVFDAILDAFGPVSDAPGRMVLAVSGGGDSMALLRLAHRWSQQRGTRITAVTVDHGLRPESAAEAEQVAGWCRAIDVEHRTLRWEHDGTGNLPDAARNGRYRLLSDFCRSEGVEALYTGHTRDDQAETVLMRLARGSGVDGLSAMARETRLWGITVIRPLLGETRENLRGYLKEFGQEWIDDPTNDDTGFDRIKAREALRILAPLGLTTDKLVRTAEMMRLARSALEQQASSLMKEAVERTPLGEALIDIGALRSAPSETALRCLAEVLCRVSGNVYRPRLDAVSRVLKWAASESVEGGLSLHGTLLRRHRGGVLVFREPSACAAVTLSGGSGIWDARFCIEVAPAGGYITAMLGEAGLRQIPKDFDGFSEAWRVAPREARLTTPGLWQGERLLSAPLAPWQTPDAPPFSVAAIWPASCETGSREVE